MSPPDPSTLERRTFLSRIAMALSALAATLVAMPPLAFVFGPVIRRKSETWRDVGPVTQFPLGTTHEVIFDSPGAERWAGVSERMGAWLRRTGDTEFTAFSIDCTHLGCPVRWKADADLFMCPCHGGVFYADGRVAAGPPAEPLRHYPVRVRDGRVEVSTHPIPIV